MHASGTKEEGALRRLLHIAAPCGAGRFLLRGRGRSSFGGRSGSVGSRGGGVSSRGGFGSRGGGGVGSLLLNRGGFSGRSRGGFRSRSSFFLLASGEGQGGGEASGDQNITHLNNSQGFEKLS